MLPSLAVLFATLRRTLKPCMNGLLSQRVSFLADSDCVFPELRAEDAFNEEDGLEGRDVDIVEKPPEAPHDPSQ